MLGIATECQVLITLFDDLILDVVPKQTLCRSDPACLDIGPS